MISKDDEKLTESLETENASEDDKLDDAMEVAVAPVAAVASRESESYRGDVDRESDSYRNDTATESDCYRDDGDKCCELNLMKIVAARSAAAAAELGSERSDNTDVNNLNHVEHQVQVRRQTQKRLHFLAPSPPSGVARLASLDGKQARDQEDVTVQQRETGVRGPAGNDKVESFHRMHRNLQSSQEIAMSLSEQSLQNNIENVVENDGEAGAEANSTSDTSTRVFNAAAELVRDEEIATAKPILEVTYSPEQRSLTHRGVFQVSTRTEHESAWDDTRSNLEDPQNLPTLPEPAMREVVEEAIFEWRQRYMRQVFRRTRSLEKQFIQQLGLPFGCCLFWLLVEIPVVVSYIFFSCCFAGVSGIFVVLLLWEKILWRADINAGCMEFLWRTVVAVLACACCMLLYSVIFIAHVTDWLRFYCRFRKVCWKPKDCQATPNNAGFASINQETN